MNALLKFLGTALAVAITVQGTSMNDVANVAELSAAAPSERARVGMTLQRFALVSPMDVYGRYATRLSRFEGTLSLGNVFGSGLEFVRDVTPSPKGSEPVP